jgi:hypothetical protein
LLGLFPKTTLIGAAFRTATDYGTHIAIMRQQAKLTSKLTAVRSALGLRSQLSEESSTL